MTALPRTGPARTLDQLHQLHRAGPQAQAIIRELLDHSGTPDALAAAFTYRPLRSAALDVARALVERLIDEGQPWTDCAAAWLSRAQADWQTSAVFCNQTAWYARSRRNSATTHLTGTNHLAASGADPVHDRALRHLQLVALRYDFRCQSIQTLIDTVPTEPRERWDPYTRALEAFALLGQSSPRGLAAMRRSLAEAGDNAAVLHALLHGLWLADDLPDQAEQILHLAAHPAFATNDPIALMRKATALRLLGRRTDALDTIGRAMEALGPDAPDVHADLVRERSLITALPRSAPCQQWISAPNPVNYAPAPPQRGHAPIG